MINSVVLIVPAQYREQLNALGEVLGYGPDSYNVDLSASGLAPATHFGAHSWEQPGGQFHALRVAVQAGVTPPGLEAHADALRSITVRAVENSTDALSNWTAALADDNLKEIAPL